MRQFFQLIALISACNCSLSANPQDDSPPASHIECISSMRIPHYPILARSARLQGAASVALTVNVSGQAEGIDISGVAAILTNSVREAISAASYKLSCSGRAIRLHFHFVIKGTPSELPITEITYSYPNLFVVATNPPIMMP